jgi:hypothetical protein
MAGSFGFEAGDKHRVSVAEGERVLLPAVRNAARSTIVVADGFSCKTQIAQGTRRRALHVAEVLDMAMRQDGGAAARAAADEPPERRVAEEHRRGVRASMVRAGVALAAGAVALVAAGALLRGRRR